MGSQIFDHEPFCDAAVIMLEYIAKIRDAHGYTARILNLGGGMAVPYVEKDGSVDYTGNICAIGKLIETQCAALGMPAPTILMEPGRSMVADSGMTVYTVGSVKEIEGYKNF